MTIVSLPLHVWDRELDSRCLLASYMAHLGHTVFLGHEYNLSLLYHSLDHLYLLGAGRPLFSIPRTTSWYEPIIKKGGFVGLIYEEGINDIQHTTDGLVPGINQQSIDNFSRMYAWTQSEVDDFKKSAPSLNLSLDIEKKSVVCSNQRIEMLGMMGQEYFNVDSAAINQIFGKFILITDNFGIDVYGTKRQYTGKNDLMQRTDDQSLIAKYLEKEQDWMANKRKARDNFLQIINQLIADHPSINFILRPHPVADPKYWYDNLIKSRNVNVIYRGPIEPWIFSSSCVIHSGCTVGLQAELAHTPSIDISQLTHDSRKAISSLVSRYRPHTVDELNKSIVESFNSDKYIDINYINKCASLPMNEPFEILQHNQSTINQSALSCLKENNIVLPKTSATSTLLHDFEAFSTNNSDGSGFSTCADISNKLMKRSTIKPNYTKSRYYSLKEIADKCRYAQKVLKLSSPIDIKKISRNNVFCISKVT